MTKQVEKTKIEQFIEDNNLTMEIEIKGGVSSVFIYAENDLFLTKFNNESLHSAIDLAVNNYMKRSNK